MIVRIMFELSGRSEAVQLNLIVMSHHEELDIVDEAHRR